MIPTRKPARMSDPDITPDLLLQAYAAGIFPMAESRDDPEIFWVDPTMRGVLPLRDFHVSRSLAKRIRKGGFWVSINADFATVVELCADRADTWINEQIRDLYNQLHKRGHAHSIEVWKEGQLIGGVYGVTLGAAFFGESMFSRAPDGSKIALTFLVDRLQQAGFVLFDTQFLTPHLASLGAVEVPRAGYHAMLNRALSKRADFKAPPAAPSYLDVLQRMTQTS